MLCEYWSYERTDGLTAAVKRTLARSSDTARETSWMRAVKVNPPSDKRRSAFRWVVTVTRSCCCGGFTPARFPAGQNFPPLLVSVPGFISDPLKVPSGSKQKNKRVTQRAEDSVWAGHLHRYTGAHLQHAARRWLKRWSWARCPEGSGPCSPCCHRTSHRLRRWRMFLRTCSRWVQPHTDATMMMMKRKRWSSPQVSSAVTWKKSSEHTHTHTHTHTQLISLQV